MALGLAMIQSATHQLNFTKFWKVGSLFWLALENAKFRIVTVENRSVDKDTKENWKENSHEEDRNY